MLSAHHVDCLFVHSYFARSRTCRGLGDKRVLPKTQCILTGPPHLGDSDRRLTIKQRTRAFRNKREYGISRGHHLLPCVRAVISRSRLAGQYGVADPPTVTRAEKGAPTGPATGYPEIGVVGKNARMFSSTAVLDGLNHNK
jgi:hypothetical protein